MALGGPRIGSTAPPAAFQASPNKPCQNSGHIRSKLRQTSEISQLASIRFLSSGRSGFWSEERSTASNLPSLLHKRDYNHLYHLKNNKQYSQRCIIRRKSSENSSIWAYFSVARMVRESPTLADHSSSPFLRIVVAVEPLSCTSIPDRRSSAAVSENFFFKVS